MAKANLNQTSFTTGEIAPRTYGRTDIDRYQAALKRAYNCHPVITGGLKRREGSLYVTAAASNTANASRLVPFIQGRGLAWQLEFLNNAVRVYALDGTLVTTLTSPYGTAVLGDIEFAQSENTLYLFHATVVPQRLQRLGTGTWVLSPAPFTTLPFAEVGEVRPETLTLSLATVGTGRTATASGGFFLQADVGRAIIYDAGIAVITGWTSGTVVTVEITRAFPSVNVPANWTLEGSPQSEITPGAATPVGATTTLTLTTAGWRSTMVGSMVRLNGGLLRITGFTSSTVVNALILRELTGTTAAQALAWTLEPPVWTAALGYPKTGTVHQQRLIAAGNAKFPRTVWGSRIGEPLDFELGTGDSDAFAFTIDSDESTAIAHVVSARDLMVLTESGEYSMRGGVEKPITPTNVRVVQESNHGCTAVRPTRIGREVMFIQAAGRKIRALGYRYDFDGYACPDVTALADHITKGGVTAICYQQEPDLMLWIALGNGKFATCTIDRDQSPSVVGWAGHETTGVVESLSCVPSGERNVVWSVVRRTINGATVRYIERFDGTFVPLLDVAADAQIVYQTTVDCGKVVDNAGGATVITGLAHLEGETVTAVGDGLALGEFTVASGQITIPVAHKRVLVGKGFRSEGTLLTPEFNTGEGSAQGAAARTGELTMRFMDTLGAKVIDDEGGVTEVPFQQFGAHLLDAASSPFSGLKRVSKLGWKRGVSELTIVQDQPLPMQLLSVARGHTAN